MSVKSCTSDRAKKCVRERDDSYNQCTEHRDEGYSECAQNRDDGYKDCCGWIPCRWFCRAWIWVSHLVCVLWNWIANVVCVVWTWIKNIVCVLWVYLTAAICLIPGIGPYISRFLDGLVNLVLGTITGIIAGVIGIISHPIEAVRTIISLFQGCPKTRAVEPGPLQIIAHHGSTLELPENTLQSCQRALTLGATALEIDICMTADEQLILWHDWDPNDLISVTRQIEIAQSDNAFKPRVPEVDDRWRRPTIELTLADFRDHFSYQDERDAAVAIKWKIDHGDIDLTVPTLPEFFAAATHWEKLRTVYIDVKMPATSALRYAGPMADQIRALSGEMRQRQFNVVVMVPDSLVLQVMKARADERGYSLVFTWDVEFPPGVILNPLSYSAVDHATSSLFHNAAASVGRPVAALFPWRIYRRTIEYDIRRRNQVNSDPAGQNAGVRIDSLIAWTINDKDEMACLAQMGVSGIITDEIGDLLAVAAANGR
jgi:glycerophosphoryl diester phosphodiesterase